MSALKHHFGKGPTASPLLAAVGKVLAAARGSPVSDLFLSRENPRVEGGGWGGGGAEEQVSMCMCCRDASRTRFPFPLPLASGRVRAGAAWCAAADRWSGWRRSVGQRVERGSEGDVFEVTWGASAFPRFTRRV